jgi:type IV fimbrial biogenesis protein FimT
MMGMRARDHWITEPLRVCGRAIGGIVRIGRTLDRGVTLIETMIVVVILGILLATVLPSFARFLSFNRAAGATSDLVHAIALTRSEALRRNRRVYLAPTDTHWRDGWAVFVDRNDNRLFDPPDTGSGGDELIFRHAALPATVAITNPANAAHEPFTDAGSPHRAYVMFDGAGYARQRNGALLLGSLVVTDTTGSARTVRTICLAAYGRVRVVADRASC